MFPAFGRILDSSDDPSRDAYPWTHIMNTRLCLIALPAVFTCLAALSSVVRPVLDTVEPASVYHPH